MSEKRYINSHAIRYEEFFSAWYKKWAPELKQTAKFIDNPIHNKNWQNAAIIQSIFENGFLKKDSKAIGFGVGNERVPGLLAKYSVSVTATDQDPEVGIAKGWDNGQLAYNVLSLNKYKICTKAQMEKYITYRQCDMNRIKKEFSNKYDVVWSNCALGHLGNIEKGLEFIEKSLACLVPGGMAVHTTELNIHSNTTTLDNTGTVLFRYRDIEKLFRKLRLNGYVCETLSLDLGSSKFDKDISFEPYPKDNLLKLSVLGHMISQIIIVIHKPKVKTVDKHLAKKTYIKMIRERAVNKYYMKCYYYSNVWLKKYVRDQGKALLTDKLIVSGKKIKPSKLNKDYRTVTVTVTNNSDARFFDFHHAAHNTYPLTIATDNPLNRVSKLHAKDWFSDNRPTVSFNILSQPNKQKDDYSLSNGDSAIFSFDIKLTSKEKLKKESFCLVLERLGKIPGSEFSIY